MGFDDSVVGNVVVWLLRLSCGYGCINKYMYVPFVYADIIFRFSNDLGFDDFVDREMSLFG